MKKIVLILLMTLSFVGAQEHVVLQLPWLHQFQFAGYYVAKEKGYYADNGLEVSIVEAQQKEPSVETVLRGAAQYGVGHSSLVVNFSKGAPIRMMMAAFQSSPMVLLTRKDANIQTAHDLRGKRIMLTEDMVNWAEIQAMLKNVNINKGDFSPQKHSYDATSLEKKQTDAMVSYLSNEPYILGERGVQTHPINPKDYGFNYYSDILFTTQGEIVNHPKRVERFYDASMRGWLWAFDHIEETAWIIYRHYNTQNKSLEALIYEGKILKELAFRPNTAFGSIEPSRLETIVQGYRLMGLVNNGESFDSIVYKRGTLNFTPQEKAWLASHPVVRVGIDQNWPPIEFVDKNGEYFGISASYLKLLEKRLGIKFEVDFSHSTWNDSLNALGNKKLDMLSCAAITPKRKESMEFSHPYMKQSIVIVANSNVGYVHSIDDLAGKKVAVVQSYATEEFLQKNHPNIIIVSVKTSLDALKMVANGEAYACLEGLNVVSYLMERHELKKLKVVGETSYNYELAFAFRNDWKMLAQISDKVLASMTPAEYKEVHGQWLVMEHARPFDYFYIWVSALVVIVVLLFIVYKNRRLDELVRQRTDELEAFNQKLQDEVDKAVEKNRTQEKILMQQAKMAEIGSMVESIAHQWRQPLNILGLSMTKLNLSLGLGINTQDTEKTIEIVEQQMRYMSQTIDDFRNFFKQDRVQTRVNINNIVGEIETLLGPLLANKNIEFIRDIDPEITALVYSNELKQVLINIVNNGREAIEHSKKKEKKIIVSCVNDKHHCIISIEDTGGGVPLHIIDKIFDPYFTTKFESQGTGIGLYMAKMIIEKHFLGKLGVHNTARGACFELRLNHQSESAERRRK